MKKQEIISQISTEFESKEISFSYFSVKNKKGNEIKLSITNASMIGVDFQISYMGLDSKSRLVEFCKTYDIIDNEIIKDLLSSLPKGKYFFKPKSK